VTPLSFGLVLFGVLLNATAQLCLKAGTNAVGQFAFTSANLVPVGWRLATQPFILAGLACYALSVVIWVMALSRVQVSVAYPMLSIGYVVNALAARILFDEPVSSMRVAGIFIIVLGVYLVARS
jgi:multidrug transporter EmrE-like cation transporter